MGDRTAYWIERRVLHEKRMAEARRVRGDACEVCGSDERLEWDHVDPATKVASITSMVNRSDATFWAEVAKCQLLCRPCHVEKTLRAGEFANGRAKHRGPSTPHGLTGYTARGCRCDICKAAKRVANAARPSRAQV